MRHFLNPSIRTVFIMLGAACNLSCKYCLQRPVLTQNHTHMHADLIPFLRDIATGQDEPVWLHFYGGEPLLHVQTIKDVVSATEDIPNVHFSMVTNGTLMTDELVTYFNEHHVACTVSWDGPRTAEVRGVDVMAHPDTRKAILSLHETALLSVISPYNYPLATLDALAELDTEYMERTGQSLFINFDELMDTGLADRSLIEIDTDRLYSEMSVIAAETEKLLHDQPCNPWRAHLGKRYLQRLQNGVEGRTSFLRGTCACGNGYGVLNVDLQGNLYRCHNTDSIVGTIHDKYQHYLSNVVLNDPTREHTHTCKDCDVVSLCNCGCPLMSQKVRQESYCKIKRAALLPFVELAMKMGQDKSSL